MSEIVASDCVDYLRRIESDSVGLIIADPPYNIGFDGGDCWDSQWETDTDYLRWCRAWTEECARVLAPGRMLCVWGTLKTDTFLRYRLDILSQLPNLCAQNEIIWSYNWGGRTSKNFPRKHEYVWCYSKGSDFLFNADDVRVERAMTHNIRTGEAYTKGTVPTCVWHQNNHTMSKLAANWHPTSKNIDVLARLVSAYSNPNDIVLDPFMGSGSTALACLKTGRQYFGCDNDVTYCKRAVERIHFAVTENLL